MRVVATDRRPVPAGVDVAPPLSMWILTGGATYDPATQEITLPAFNALIKSPLIRVDAAKGISLTTPVYVPAGGDARTVTTMRYFGPNGTTPAVNSAGYAANGSAATGATDTWRTWNVYTPLGAGISYMHWELTINTSYGHPGTRYRQPTITLTR